MRQALHQLSYYRADRSLLIHTPTTIESVDLELQLLLAHEKPENLNRVIDFRRIRNTLIHIHQLPTELLVDILQGVLFEHRQVGLLTRQMQISPVEAAPYHVILGPPSLCCIGLGRCHLINSKSVAIY